MILLFYEIIKTSLINYNIYAIKSIKIILLNIKLFIIKPKFKSMKWGIILKIKEHYNIY